MNHNTHITSTSSVEFGALAAGTWTPWTDNPADDPFHMMDLLPAAVIDAADTLAEFTVGHTCDVLVHDPSETVTAIPRTSRWVVRVVAMNHAGAPKSGVLASLPGVTVGRSRGCLTHDVRDAVNLLAAAVNVGLCPGPWPGACTNPATGTLTVTATEPALSTVTGIARDFLTDVIGDQERYGWPYEPTTEIEFAYALGANLTGILHPDATVAWARERYWRSAPVAELVERQPEYGEARNEILRRMLAAA